MFTIDITLPPACRWSAHNTSLASCGWRHDRLGPSGGARKKWYRHLPVKQYLWWCLGIPTCDHPFSHFLSVYSRQIPPCFYALGLGTTTRLFGPSPLCTSSLSMMYFFNRNLSFLVVPRWFKDNLLMVLITFTSAKQKTNDTLEEFWQRYIHIVVLDAMLQLQSQWMQSIIGLLVTREKKASGIFWA